MSSRKANKPRQWAPHEVAAHFQLATRTSKPPTELTRRCQACGHSRPLLGFRKLAGRWVCPPCQPQPGESHAH